jgi:phospholipid/cholesterol/gamma-HCH transport system ATP-binding protein
MAAPEIIIKDLEKSFGSEKILAGINLTLLPGKINFIIGESGGGKSVLLKHLTGLYRADSGQIWYDNLELGSAKISQLRALRKRMGFLFQDGALFDSLTVRDNVVFPLWFHRLAKKETANKKAERLLTDLGLGGSSEVMIGSLSPGERKRVALARALIMEPEILFFDEPTTGLDPLLSAQVDELIILVQKTSKATIVVVSHDIDATLKLANQVSMIHKGKIILSGEPELFRSSEKIEVKQFIQGEG